MHRRQMVSSGDTRCLQMLIGGVEKQRFGSAEE